MTPSEIRQTHKKVREILQDYGCEEFGDCIIDEICFTFGFPTTTDLKVDYENVDWWFYRHDSEWQNDMEEAFYASDNTEGARSYIDWAYMQFNPGVEIEY